MLVQIVMSCVKFECVGFKHTYNNVYIILDFSLKNICRFKNVIELSLNIYVID